MRKAPGSTLGCILFLLVAPRAGAVTLFDFDVLPGSGFQIGPLMEDLTGGLTFALGDPAPSGNSPFDLVDLALTSTTGVVIGLDLGFANPGLGVLSPSGAFLIPTLLLQVGNGAVFPLTLSDVTGSVDVPLGEGSVLVVTSIDVGSGISVQLQAGVASAVPEPGAFALFLCGLGVLRSLGRPLGRNT